MIASNVLSVEDQGAIRTLRLNRPVALNALNPELGDALYQALSQTADAVEIRVVVITGAGGNFMSGGDIGYFAEALDGLQKQGSDALAPLFASVHGTIRLIREMPKPVIASVEGAAAGFGLSLVAACDLSIAADHSVFTLAYCNIGASPDGGSTYFLPRLIGLKRSFELALLGERFEAQQAKEIGLVNFVVPGGQLTQQTEQLAERLARGPAAAYARTKALLNHSLHHSLNQQLDMEQAEFLKGAVSSEFAEGVRAFCEKRRPKFD